MNSRYWPLSLLSILDSGSMEFVVPPADPSVFFPINIRFTAANTFSDVKVRHFTFSRASVVVYIVLPWVLGNCILYHPWACNFCLEIWVKLSETFPSRNFFTLGLILRCGLLVKFSYTLMDHVWRAGCMIFFSSFSRLYPDSRSQK